ncbi:MAG: hypothetical protein EOO50_14930 [Flavobacterium sp.]|uniref:hypothetical protein n=1 Tax=Flavobacterium sp. TaxID=239 RepID=UPI001220D5F7|nr:hypothetical protein [Flavobacterium sp.]RZJ65132.1 MAG: hypothetical protein EOO50_14930 [Flavobacterium sp.]
MRKFILCALVVIALCGCKKQKPELEKVDEAQIEQIDAAAIENMVKENFAREKAAAAKLQDLLSNDRTDVKVQTCEARIYLEVDCMDDVNWKSEYGKYIVVPPTNMGTGTSAKKVFTFPLDVFADKGDQAKFLQDSQEFIAFEFMNPTFTCRHFVAFESDAQPDGSPDPQIYCASAIWGDFKRMVNSATPPDSTQRRFDSTKFETFVIINASCSPSRVEVAVGNFDTNSHCFSIPALKVFADNHNVQDSDTVYFEVTTSSPPALLIFFHDSANRYHGIYDFSGTLP